MSLVGSAIERKVAAIISSSEYDPNLMNAAATKAERAGIPYVLLVTRAYNETGANAQISPNDYQGAKLGAQELAKLMNSEGSYVELIGNETNPIALIRSKGYSDILSQYPNLKKLKIVSANW